MVKDDDGLIREVNEAYRQDKAKEWWDQFGRRVIVVTGAIIAITASVVLYQNHTLSQQAEKTAQFFLGLEQYQMGEYEAALEQFSTLTDTGDKDGATVLAELYSAHAQMRLNGGQVPDNTFADIADGAPEPVAALAAIQSVYAAEANAPTQVTEAWFAPMLYQMELAEAITSEMPTQPTAPEGAMPVNLQQRVDILESALRSKLSQETE